MLLSYSSSNAIREQIQAWSMLTREGNPEEKKQAKKYLQSSGLDCFIFASSAGRPEKRLKNYQAKNPLFQKWYPYWGNHLKEAKDLLDSYERLKRQLRSGALTDSDIRRLKSAWRKKRQTLANDIIEERVILLKTFLEGRGIKLSDKEIRELSTQPTDSIAREILTKEREISISTFYRKKNALKSS
jgi:hypothetical protein